MPDKSTANRRAVNEGSVAGTAGTLIAGAIVANNPELSWGLAPLAGLFTGLITGGYRRLQLWWSEGE